MGAIKKKSIMVSMTFFVAFLMIVNFGAVTASQQRSGSMPSINQNNYMGNQLGVSFAPIQHLVNAIESAGSRTGHSVSTTSLFTEVNDSLKTFLGSAPFMNYYSAGISGGVSINWGMSYNYPSANLTFSFQFDTQSGNFTREVTWSANSQGWISSSPNVTTSPVVYYQTQYQNWGGWEFWNWENSAYQVINSVEGVIPVVSISSPPANQMTGNYMGASPWIGLENEAGGQGGFDNLGCIYQTGYDRQYDNNGIPGTSDYWHSYGLWYETYPLGAFPYIGSPSLTPGWTLTFNVTYTHYYIYYWVIIDNLQTVYTASTYDPAGYYKPYYMTTIVENDNFLTTAGRINGQLPEFSEVDFPSTFICPGPSLGTLYVNGEYNYYQISTYPNDENTNIVYQGSGGTFQPGITWENSYYNWSYCNP